MVRLLLCFAVLTAGSVAWLTISEGRNCFARSSNLFATLIGDRASFALLIALLCERSTQEGSSAAQDGSLVACATLNASHVMQSKKGRLASHVVRQHNL